jgi:hypothetical protein
MDLVLEDFGQEKLLPSFKCRRPGADYFNSSVNIRKMSFVNPRASGRSIMKLRGLVVKGSMKSAPCAAEKHCKPLFVVVTDSL